VGLCTHILCSDNDYCPEFNVVEKHIKQNMNNFKTFRECISENKNELIIFAADNFAQFPQRNSSIASKCDRTLPAAGANDLVVLRGNLDREYHSWLRSVGLGSDLVVEYGENEKEMTLSELIICNPDPIKALIHKTARKPVYVPWFSSIAENEAAKVLEAELFGASASETLKYNDKASFTTICKELNIPVVEGVSLKRKRKTGRFMINLKALFWHIFKNIALLYCVELWGIWHLIV